MELVKCFEELIRQMVNPSLMTDIEFGEVLEESPLKIKLNDIITLEENNLILTNAVKDHEVDVTVSWYTENVKIPGVDNHTHNTGVATDGKWTGKANVVKSENIDSEHRHEIKNKKKIIIHNGLKKEEKVLLIKGLGGQKYVVLDRLTDYECKGEWNE